MSSFDWVHLNAPSLQFSYNSLKASSWLLNLTEFNYDYQFAGCKALCRAAGPSGDVGANERV